MSKAQVIPIDSPLSARKRREIVDEFGRLSLKIEAAAKDQERYEQLRKQIAGWHEKDDAEQSFSEEGAEWSVELSACSFKRAITSMPKLKAYLGLTRFLQLCKFNLCDIDKHVPLEDRKAFVSCQRSGSRTVTPIQKDLGERMAA